MLSCHCARLQYKHPVIFNSKTGGSLKPSACQEGKRNEHRTSVFPLTTPDRVMR
jgi:hypothetical protein